MKQKILTLSMVAMLAANLAACSNSSTLSPEDRAFLVQVRNETEQAKTAAAQAAAEAREARKAAELAAASASSMSEKTSRIYDRSQDK